MIGDRKNSLLEVGLDAEIGIITSVTLVAVDALTEIEELPLLVEPIQVEGLPIFDVEGWSEDGYEIEKAEFKIFKVTDRLLILLTEEFHPSLKITNDRVSFGFDAQHNLILIEIASLMPFEMEEVLFNISR
jgi:hypothetical protein